MVKIHERCETFILFNEVNQSLETCGRGGDGINVNLKIFMRLNAVCLFLNN